MDAILKELHKAMGEIPSLPRESLEAPNCLPPAGSADKSSGSKGVFSQNTVVSG